MTRDEIEALIPLIPADAPYLRHLPELDLPVRQVAQKAKFISAVLTDPRFGWKFVNGFIRANQPLPWQATWNDALAFAYRHIKTACHDPESRPVLYAMALEMPDCHVLRSVVKCALCAPDKTVEEIDAWLQLPEGTTRIYNDLFFNVADRRDEPAYLAGIIWPNGRLDELSDTYLQSEDRGMLMLRATMTQGLDSALQLVGMSNGGQLDGVSGTTKLESAIMTNANRIAGWGGLNQSRGLAGLHHGKAVLIAVRGAGETTMSDDELALHNINAVAPALEEIRKHNGLNGPPPEHYALILEETRSKAAFAPAEQQAARERKLRAA